MLINKNSLPLSLLQWTIKKTMQSVIHFCVIVMLNMITVFICILPSTLCNQTLVVVRTLGEIIYRNIYDFTKDPDIVWSTFEWMSFYVKTRWFQHLKKLITAPENLINHFRSPFACGIHCCLNENLLIWKACLFIN